MRDIQHRFDITDHDATGPVADELVVALPLSRIAGQLLSPDRYIVVTQESLGGRGATKIPNVCEPSAWSALSSPTCSYAKVCGSISDSRYVELSGLRCDRLSAGSSPSTAWAFVPRDHFLTVRDSGLR